MRSHLPVPQELALMRRRRDEERARMVIEDDRSRVYRAETIVAEAMERRRKEMAELEAAEKAAEDEMMRAMQEALRQQGQDVDVNDNGQGANADGSAGDAISEVRVCVPSPVRLAVSRHSPPPPTALNTATRDA